MTKPDLPSPGQPAAAASDLPSAADALPRFVRVRGRRGDLITFDFAIGWPDLAVELAMPEADFEAFCEQHCATRLPPDAAPTPLGHAPHPTGECS